MVIDFIYILILLYAGFKGFQRGLIVGIFSFLSIIIGLAAAIKLSAVVAGYIGQTVNVSARWLPVISFLVVFIIIVILIRLGANLVQKAVEAVALGWVNRLGGILLYMIVFTIAYSILLFYADKMGFLTPAAKENSATYSFIEPWGPTVIDAFGSIIPFFKNMFAELESFFTGVAQKIPEKN